VRVHRLRDVADWNTYALVGAIEKARSAARNPAIPPWLKSGYEEAWRALPALALRDLARSEEPLLARSALGVLAMARGLRRAGEILLEFTDYELGEMVSLYRVETSCASGDTSTPYREAFPKGTRVRIRPLAALERFRLEWRWHHRLHPDQLQSAGRAATVQSVGFYHGGNVLYVLDGVPGIWHEVCLEADGTT